MSAAFKCDRCGKLFTIDIITHENKQVFKVIRSNTVDLDLCGECQKALEYFLAGKTFSPHEVYNKIVTYGQSDKQFKLGEIIKYNPTETEQDEMPQLRKESKGHRFKGKRRVNRKGKGMSSVWI